MKTILATYTNHSNADLAVEALKRAGVPSADIGLIASDPNVANSPIVSTTAAAPAGQTAGKAATDAAAGAVTGGMLGGVGGLLLGVAALTIPGLGALLIAGPLAAALGLTGVAATAATGAGIGVAAGGITSLAKSLIQSGVSEADANFVETNVKSGGVVVSVKESASINVRACLEAGHPSKISVVG